MTTKPRKSTTKKVDETVINQENPISSEEEKESTNTLDKDAEVVKNVPANEVDETVINQEALGSGNVVDRNPDPVIFEDSNGIKYDVSKSYPELVTEDPEAEVRKVQVRQDEAVLNAKNIEGPDDDKYTDHDHINIYFLESGLTVEGRVWKKGQTLVLEDNADVKRSNTDIEDDVWYEQNASQQEKRYGKVFFEKR